MRRWASRTPGPCPFRFPLRLSPFTAMNEGSCDLRSGLKDSPETPPDFALDLENTISYLGKTQLHMYSTTNYTIALTVAKVFMYTLRSF